MDLLSEQRDCQDTVAAKARPDQRADFCVDREQTNNPYARGSVERLAKKGKAGFGLCRETRVVEIFRLYTLCCFKQLALSNVALLLN